MPLYGLLLHFWIQLFGVNVLTARVLSLLFYLLTLPVLYMMVKESSNRKIALLTICLFTLSPFVAWYSFEARMYTLFTFVTSLNHLFFLRFLRSGGGKGKFGYFLSTLIGFYTHYFFVFVVLTQVLFIAGRSISDIWHDFSWGNLFRKILDLPLKFSLILLFASIFFIPWIFYVLSQGAAANTQPLISNPTTYNLFQTYITFLFGFQNVNIQAIFISLWPLFIIILFLLFTHKRVMPIADVTYFIVVTFLPILLAFVISYFRPIFLSRYLIFVTPTLFTLVAWIILNYPKKIASYVALGMVLMMFGMLIYQNISLSTPVKENYDPLAKYLTDNSRPQDIIAISAPFTIYPIEYSYQGNSRIDTIPQWNRYNSGSIPSFSDTEMVKQVENYKGSYNRIFLVLSYDQGYEKQVRDYFDNNFELNNSIKFSPDLEMREYQLRY